MTTEIHKAAKPMTRAEALAEARKRWGESGFAYINGQDTPFSRPWYSIGHREWWGELVYFNSHDSWEAAFADADRRAK